MGKGKHLDRALIAGVARDIQDEEKYVNIMYRWDISHGTLNRIHRGVRLIKKRADPAEIAKAIASNSITGSIADWVTSEIDRIKREEEEAARVAENAIVELESVAVESARSVINPDEIIYSLMRIEDLLGKLLVCWGGADGGKV